MGVDWLQWSAGTCGIHWGRLVTSNIASEPYTNALVLRVTLYFFLCWCVIHCLVLLSFVIAHVKRPRATITNITPPTLNNIHYVFLLPIYHPSCIPYFPTLLTHRDLCHWGTHACLEALHRDICAHLDAPHQDICVPLDALYHCLSCSKSSGTGPQVRSRQGHQVLFIFFSFWLCWCLSGWTQHLRLPQTSSLLVSSIATTPACETHWGISCSSWERPCSSTLPSICWNGL